MNLRKLAQGQDCQVRLAGICNGDPETVVLAHYRLAGTCGTGIKPPDELGCPACSRCHDICDGRVPRPKWLSRVDVLLAFAEGVLRWTYLRVTGKLGVMK